MLSQEERDRFATWLEQDADSSEQILQHLSGGPGAIPQLSGQPGSQGLARMLLAEVTAERIVAKKLRKIQDINHAIGGQHAPGSDG